jgi:hypothetical protein
MSLATVLVLVGGCDDIDTPGNVVLSEVDRVSPSAIRRCHLVEEPPSAEHVGHEVIEQVNQVSGTEPPRQIGL